MVYYRDKTDTTINNSISFTAASGQVTATAEGWGAGTKDLGKLSLAPRSMSMSKLRPDPID